MTRSGRPARFSARSRAAFAIVSLLASVNCAPQEPHALHPRNTILTPPFTAENLAREWVADVASIRDDELVELPDLSAKSAALASESRYWCDRFFSPAASPHAAAPRARVRIHPAGDLDRDVVRFDYAYRGRSVAVFEGAATIGLRAEARGSGGLAHEIDELAGAFLVRSGTAPRVNGSVPYDWRFHFTAPIGEGSYVTTKPGAPPYVSWYDRIDALVYRGHVWILLYAVEGDRQQKGWPEDQGWFKRLSD